VEGPDRAFSLIIASESVMDQDRLMVAAGAATTTTVTQVQNNEFSSFFKIRRCFRVQDFSSHQGIISSLGL
jgi:hypothetical protein